MASVTLLDVAAAARVSKTTASDILRGASDAYNPATVQMVRETAELLGYQANAAARLLRQGKSGIIGLAVGVRQRAFINSLVVAAHDECIKRGYQPAIFEPYHLLPKHNFSPFPSPDLLDGVLSIDLSVNSSLPESYASLHKRLPVVALYSVDFSAIDSVSTDWGAGTEKAVEHLVKLGHRSIAYAHDPSLSYPVDRARAQRWQECLEKYQLDARCQLTYQVPSTLANMGDLLINAPSQPIANFIEQVLNNLRALSVVPTAILCTSDELALALSARLMQWGWKLPQDLSIVGFYGTDFGEYVFPRLTTVALPFERIGSTALDRLQLRMAHKENQPPVEVCHTLLEPQLIVRESTAAPRTGQAPPLH